jgi:SAM-dependent methyltransferase
MVVTGKIRLLMFEVLTSRNLGAGVGTGQNFPIYPSTANVIGVDLSPVMLARSRATARIGRRAGRVAANGCHLIGLSQPLL